MCELLYCNHVMFNVIVHCCHGLAGSLGTHVALSNIALQRASSWWGGAGQCNLREQSLQDYAVAIATI